MSASRLLTTTEPPRPTRKRAAPRPSTGQFEPPSALSPSPGDAKSLGGGDVLPLSLKARISAVGLTSPREADGPTVDDGRPPDDAVEDDDGAAPDDGTFVPERSAEAVGIGGFSDGSSSSSTAAVMLDGLAAVSRVGLAVK